MSLYSGGIIIIERLFVSEILFCSVLFLFLFFLGGGGLFLESLLLEGLIIRILWYI